LIIRSTEEVDGPISARDISYAVRKKLEIPLAKCLLSSERDKQLKVFCETDDKIGVLEEEILKTEEE
jgi:ATP-dependent Clp protease ATP-binding subunit ClpA